METKKAWEFLLLAHPCSQAFALPQLKDKHRRYNANTRQISCNNQNDKKSRVNTNIYSI